MEISPLVGLMTKAVGHLKCPLMHERDFSSEYLWPLWFEIAQASVT